MAVRDREAMIAGMAPVLLPGDVAFVSMEPGNAMQAMGSAVAAVREAEGMTLVLPIGAPQVPGGALPMRQITLTIHSALDGVGLTAAVAGALAGADIPCNVIAGFHHDHIFVPSADAERAMNVLRDLAAAG